MPFLTMETEYVKLIYSWTLTSRVSYFPKQIWQYNMQSFKTWKQEKNLKILIENF